MGFITNQVLALTHPSFLVEASRAVVYVTPEDLANRVGVLTLGDIAVVDHNLDSLPWVAIPAGSQVRDANDTDRFVDLEEEAFLRVSRYDTHATVAVRCAEGSAAVHLAICRCTHWRVMCRVAQVHEVPAQEGPAESGVVVARVAKGDLLCAGHCAGSDPPRDPRFAWLGPDALLWEHQCFNDAPRRLLEDGSGEAAILKENENHEKVLSKVRQKFQGGGNKTTNDAASAPAVEPREDTSTAAEDKSPADAAGQGSGDRGGSAEAVPEGAPAHEEVVRDPLELGDVAEINDISVSPEDSLAMSAQAIQKWVSASDFGARPPLSGDAAWVWLVMSSENVGVHVLNNPLSEPLLNLEAGDALVCASEPACPWIAAATAAQHSEGMWLTLKRSDWICRHGRVLAAVAAPALFVVACGADGAEIVKPWNATRATDVCIETLSGFGAPWVVKHKQVPVRNEPSTAALPLGLACKGDIVGVDLREGEWLKLAASSDSRLKEWSHARPTHDVQNHVNPKAGLWMLAAHKTIGTLLQEHCEGGVSSLGEQGLLISCRRLGMYRRVTEICHRRIWRDNLHDLWEGEVDKLPPVEALEAKLFHSDVACLHARRGGEFTGGAIVESICINVHQRRDSSTQWHGPAVPLSGLPGAEADAKAAGKDADAVVVKTGTVRVGYIHCCATEPGSHVGKPMWNEVCKLAVQRNFLLVTCHPVLLPQTVEFWRARGMRKMDPADSHNRSEFRNMVNFRTQGMLTLELEALVKALPKSALPLFIWANSGALQANDGLQLVDINANSDSGEEDS